MKTKIIGRSNEQNILNSFYTDDKSHFVALYGRRRVGKTFLVREFFEDIIDFHLTGLANSNTQEQLLNFKITINRAFESDDNKQTSWIEAFDSLIAKLERIQNKKKVVFLDELPWLDTKQSNFLSALEHFWNSWAVGRSDILLIVCGSATSWMIDKLVNNHGGLHNRLTYRMALNPFTLGECNDYFESNGFQYRYSQVVESYLVLGGVPYYMSLMEKGLSVAQNINALFFAQHAKLNGEYKNLFISLFKHSENYVKAVETMSSKKMGLTRGDIALKTHIAGGGLTTVLENLERCGFIRSYLPISRKTKGRIYQLVDHFSLFHHNFIADNRTTDENYWINIIDSPRYYNWAGYAFETLCLNHIRQIKSSLSILGVQSEIGSWRSSKSTPAAQIDMLIDRKDNVVNICEMKYSKSDFVVSREFEANLRKKREVFRNETKSNKSLHLTLVTLFGLQQNSYSDIFQNIVTVNELFKK